MEIHPVMFSQACLAHFSGLKCNDLGYCSALLAKGCMVTLCFGSIQRLGETPKMDARTVGLIFGKFLYLFAASLLLGLVFGLFSALLLKKFNVSHAPQACPTHIVQPQCSATPICLPYRGPGNRQCNCFT